MKKMDEMEKLHTLYAIRNTFAFTLVFEVIYFVIECLQAGDFIPQESMMFFLIICQGVVLILSTLIWKTKVEEAQGVKGIILACILAILAIGLGFFFK